MVAHIVTDNRPQLLNHLEHAELDSLCLQVLEKGFDKCIVIHFFHAIHALHDSIRPQLLPEAFGDVLHPFVRMKDQFPMAAPVPHRLFQCRHAQCRITATAQGPGDNSPAKAIHDHTQVLPAPTRHPDIGHITNPKLIRSLQRKIPYSVGTGL